MADWVSSTGSRWRVGPCKCPVCKQPHTDLIYNKAPRVNKNLNTIAERQECDTCLRARIGEVAYKRYRQAMEAVRL